jgi:hypothetical protein
MGREGFAGERAAVECAIAFRQIGKRKKNREKLR